MDKEATIVTHSGAFHTDDIFAVATIVLLLGNRPYRVVRARDVETIATGEYVVDVGGVYDPELKKFDHHQEGGAGKRENGIPYSSFGLVWKHYGETLCGSKSVAETIERRLVFPIDAADNGINTYSKEMEYITPYIIHNITDIFRPTWKEEKEGRDFDAGFAEMLTIAKQILQREIKKAKDEEEGAVFVRKAYDEAEDKRIIVLGDSYPWEWVLKEYREPLYVVSLDKGSNGWKVKAVRDDPVASFVCRKNLPASWAGKRGQELVDITGVPDATFCHNHCFIAGAKSKAGALQLARIAVEN